MRSKFATWETRLGLFGIRDSKKILCEAQFSRKEKAPNNVSDRVNSPYNKLLRVTPQNAC